jgi:hypothetical protein
MTRRNYRIFQLLHFIAYQSLKIHVIAWTPAIFPIDKTVYD